MCNQCKQLREELETVHGEAAAMREACEAINQAHLSLFGQCCSNPIYNSWEQRVDVTLVNEAHSKATRALSGSAGRDLLAERDRLAARVAELEAKERKREFDIAKQQALELVARMELRDKVDRLAARCKAMEGVVEAAKAWLTATRSSNPPQGAAHLAGIMFAVDALAVVPPTC